MCHNNADLINTQFCLILVGLNLNSNCYMNNNEHCHTVPLLVRIRLVFINVVHSLEDEVAIALFWWGNRVTVKGAHYYSCNNRQARAFYYSG